MSKLPNSADGESSNDPVADCLRDEFLAEASRVPGAAKFAQRLRAEVEVNHLPSPVAAVYRRDRLFRRSWAVWVGAAMLALVLWGGLRWLQVGPNEAVVEKGSVEFVKKDGLAREELAEVDASVGLELVNAVLGKAFQSPAAVERSFQGFFRPLGLGHGGVDVDQGREGVERRVFCVVDEDWVAGATARLLGIREVSSSY